MIVEFVQFKYPPGWSREQILADARTRKALLAACAKFPA
jgi:hypothetical protein